ncbi:TetR/AcrR family transcriptional regulator [Erythrobacter mangrovi]|uniref:TetR/AcrR family transcriptional regulator n=1 Tax=Erythrobacter mangrovi TaxID=2739433 RepID=A0A7D4AVC7_9SPHN|nr:TetR/AcrR family transcriptional regulator [Erythrobacter mangrovi]
MPNRSFRPAPQSARDRLLEAGVKLIRRQGYAATSVGELCAEAGVTKGAFFHHFESKEALGAELARYWSNSTSGFFTDAPFRQIADPLERILGYLDLRIALIGGPTESFSCVAGTMIQESFRSSEPIRAACRDSILGNADLFVEDFTEAVASYGVDADPKGLSLHMQVVIQGAFILAKTQDSDERAVAMARESLLHLKRYLTLLFGKETAR